MFENSPDETKTKTEKDFNISFVKQVGDIGMLVRWILFAVFFTLLLVVGNTMAQSVRERVPELAVLKTIGFSSNSVLAMVLAESVLLLVLGGVIGIGLAEPLIPLISKGSNGMLALSPVNVGSWALGGALMLGIGLLVGAVPAWSAMRLNIVDALARR